MPTSVPFSESLHRYYGLQETFLSASMCITSSVISVSDVPGQIALQRIPSLVKSTAVIAFVNEITHLWMRHSLPLMETYNSSADAVFYYVAFSAKIAETWKGLFF